MSGTEYTFNENITKAYLDFRLWYNITDKLQAGDNTINVTTSQISDEIRFYGNIKTVTVLVAYNDDDKDKIHYWVNGGQNWFPSGSQTSTSFNTNTIDTDATITDAQLYTIVLSSADGSYSFNNNPLTGYANEGEAGYYYKQHQWNVTTSINKGTASTMSLSADSGSCRLELAALTALEPEQITIPAINYNNVSWGSTTPGLFTNINNTIYLNVTDIIGDTGLTANLYINNILASTKTINTALGNNIIIFDNVKTTNTSPVNITVNLTDGVDFTLTKEFASVPTYYNGFAGKQFTGGEGLNTNRSFIGNYDVVISSGNSTYQGASVNKVTNTSISYLVSIPENSIIRNAVLYLPYTFAKTDTSNLDSAITFNGQTLTAIADYTDRKGWGSSNYPYGVRLYDITNILNTENELNITPNSNLDFGLYGSYIIAVYENNASSLKKIMINDEADLLGAGTSYKASDDAWNNYNFNISNSSISKVNITTVGAISSRTDNVSLSFNGNDLGNLTSGYNNTKQLSITTNDVTNYLNDGSNTLKIQADNTHETYYPSITALTSILTAEYNTPSNVDLTYSKGLSWGATVPGLFRNLNNTVSLSFTDDEITDLTAKLYLNDELVATEQITTASGANTVTFNNIKTSSTSPVNLKVTISNNDYTLTKEFNNVPTYYNGYAGNVFTGGEGLTTNRTFSGNYDVVISSGNSTYIPGSELTHRTNKTFYVKWNSTDLNIPTGSNIIDVMLYLPYNWVKTDSSNLDARITFNNQTLTAIGDYSDLKGWGYYDLPYGLRMYNVTNIFNTNENNLVIRGDSNKSIDLALYASYIVAVYENNELPIKKIIINDGADALSTGNNYRVYEEAWTIYPFELGNQNVNNATLTTIAGITSQANRTHLSFNGNNIGDMKNGWSNTKQISIAQNDVTNYLNNGSNTLRIQAENASTSPLAVAFTSILNIAYETSVTDLTLSDDVKFNNDWTVPTTGLISGITNTLEFYLNVGQSGAPIVPTNLTLIIGDQVLTKSVNATGTNYPVKFTFKPTSANNIKNMILIISASDLSKIKKWENIPVYSLSVKATDITGSKASTKYKSTITLTVKDGLNKAVAGQNLTINIGGRLFNVRTGSNGLVKLTVDKLTKLNYPVKISFGSASNPIVKTTTVYRASDLTVYKIRRSGNNYKITVKNIGGKASTKAKLQVYYKKGKKTYRKTVTIKALKSGQSYTVTVKFFKYSTHRKYYKYAYLYNNKATEYTSVNNKKKFRV